MQATTTEASYDADLAAANALMAKFVDCSQADGHGEKWAADALNDSWREGLTIAQWVAEAVAAMPSGFRGA